MHFAAATRSLLRQGGVAALAGLVLLLGVLARVPSAHAWLHGAAEPEAHCVAEGDEGARATQGHPGGHTGRGGHAGHADHALEGELGCAVTLFAQGLPAGAAPPQVSPPAERVELAVLRAPDAPGIQDDGRRLPPSNGPPTAAGA